MADRNDLSINLGAVDNTQPGIDSALTNLTKFTAKATKDSVVTINARLGKDFLSDISKIQSRMRKFSFEGIFSSAQGRNMWEKKIDFSKEFINGLNFEGLKNAEAQLLDLKKMLDDKRAISKGEWTKKQYEDLQKLIEYIQKAKKEYVQLQQAANANTSKQKSVIEPMAKQESILSRLTSLARRYFDVYAVARFGYKVAETTKYFEQQQVALEGILGSASAASDAIGKIKAMALESPLQTKELITDVKQLAAYGIEQEKLLDTTKQLADISIGLGVSMDRLILAYGQVKAASVLRGQELRQFTEAGIPLVQALADKFTELNGRVVTTGEVFKLISQRQVSFEMVASVLADMTKEGGKFYKMQERMTDTLYGQMEKTADMWTLAKNSLGEMMHGPLMAVVKALQLVVKNAKGFLLTITAPLIIQSLHRMSGYFGQMRDNAGRIPQIMRRTNALMSVATTSARKWHIAMAGVKVAANAAMGAITLGATILVGVISNAVLKAKEFDEAMVGVSRSFNKDTQNLKKGLDSLMYQLAANTKGTTEFNEALETLKHNYKDFINPAVVDALIAEQKQVDTTTKSWMDLRNSIISAIDARQQYEKSKARKEAAGSKIIEGFSGENAIDKLYYNLMRYGSYEDVQASGKLLPVRSDAAELLGDAVQEFFDRGLEDKSQLREIFMRRAKAANSLDVADIIAPYFDSLTEPLFKGKKWEQYLRSDKKIKSSSFYTTDTAFENARAKIASYAGSGIDKDINNDRAAIVAMTQALSKLKITSDDVNDVNNYNNAINKLNDEVSKNWDYGQTKRIADVFEELRKVVTDNTLLDGIAYIAKQFGEITNQRSGTSEKIANNIENYLGRTPLNEKSKDFIQKFIPDDKTLLQNRDKIINLYKENQSFLKEHKPDGVWKDEYDRRRNENTLLKMLFGKDFYDIDPSQFNKSGRSGGSSNFTRFFSDMFGLIKSAYTNQKKLIEGSSGITNSLITDINNLKDDNILKAFYQDGRNPFQPILDKIKDYDLETIFSASDFERLSTQFLRNVGVDKISMADFEGLWDSLLDVVKSKAQSLRAAGNTKDASKVEAYLQTMVAERAKFFGRDEIEKKIDEILKSLTNIQNTAQLNSDMFNDMKEMMKTGNYLDVWKAMNPGMEYRDRNEATTAQQTLSQLLNASPAMTAYLGGSLDSILKAERLGISLIPELYNIIQQINDIGDLDPDELKKQKDLFIDALKKLVNGIKEETTKLSDTRTSTERTSDSMFDAQKEYTDKMNVLNDALKNGGIDENTYTSRSVEALQSFVGSISELLGGSYNSDIAKLFGASTSTGSTKTGDFMQLLSSLQSGGAKGFLGTLLGQSVAGGGSMSSGAVSGAAGIAGGAAGALAMVDMIIKAVYGAIKAISEMARKTLELMQSYDDVTTVTIDAVGVMHVETKYGDYNFEKANAIIDSIEQFNQHVMDGWEKIKSGDLLGAVMETYNSYLDLIISIRKIADKDLEKLIEGMQKTGQDIDNAATNLNAAAERMVGFDKMVTQLAATGKSLEAAQNYKNMIDAETAMKLSDPDKMREWQQQYMEAINEFKNGIRELRNELVSSTEDWSSALSQAMREAFQNGENAMRNFRDVAKTMIGDIVENMLQMSILEPLIENAIQAWTNSDALMEKYTISYVDKNGYTQKTFDQDSFLRDLLKNITDQDKTDQFYSDVLTAGEAYLNAINNMPQSMQDYFKYNSSLSSLSGGIQNETEDTARRLEALANSQLGEVILIRKAVESMGGTFDGTSITSIQAEAVRMNSTLAAMLAVSQAIHNDINDMRNNIRPLWVRM